jgi:hypothetical protein
MTDLLGLILAILASLFKSRAELEAENLVLRQQISVLLRRMPKRPALTNIDRLLFVWVYHWFPSTAGGPCDRQAGDDHPLAPCWLSGLLALAIAQPRRQTENLSRIARPHWRNEPGEPTVECAAHPG